MKLSKMLITSCCLAAALTAVTPLVQAKTCDGVSFPDEARIGGSTLKLNGLGLRLATMLKVHVYVAALYVAAVSTDANAILAANTPKELRLQFVRDVDASDLRKAWQDDFEKNAKQQMPALKDRIEKLKVWTADMKTGQQLVFSHKPGTGVEVSVAGAAAGTIEGDDFANALFSIWLGAHPPNAELKEGLLGGACG
jgi:hypothetical protein